MDMHLAPITPDDRNQIIDLFNFYVENTFAAYPEQKVPYEFFDVIMQMCRGYPTVTARDGTGDVIGFGMLRTFSPFPAFAKTAEITYFVRADCMGKGIGGAILDYLVGHGKRRGLTSIVANVSSLNKPSINFHLKNGFSECGRFVNVGEKKGKSFDVVYFQKMLREDSAGDRSEA
ncbi:MAG: N-acetyltransferase family protein [Syntrophobacter sp.]